MQVLITAGPTHEPIDPVRFIGNRSSGQMGAALVAAAVAAGHTVTAILGPVRVPTPPAVRRINVETSRQMHDAVLAEWPNHDLLIMAAAVADYRPRVVAPGKLHRTSGLTLELEPTEDILAAASREKLAHQRTVGFALLAAGELQSAQQKLLDKHVDLLVFNPLNTMESRSIQATLLWPDGRQEALPPLDKPAFAALLLERASQLFG